MNNFSTVKINSNSNYKLNVTKTFTPSTLSEVIENLKTLTNEKSTFENLIDAQKNNLSHKQFLENYFSIYAVYTDKLKLTLAHAIYTNPKTYVITSELLNGVTMSEGRGRDFSYWTEFFNTKLTLVGEDTLNLDTAKTYTANEVAELLNSKKVVLLNKKIT